MPDMSQYRSRPAEQARIADLLSLLPADAILALEIGARDGYITSLLAQRIPRVVALDLAPLEFDPAGLLALRANVVALPFPEDTFDLVLCAEVLEHVQGLEAACAELVRVARGRIVIGVPHRQDTRVGRTTCQHCGKPNPPWGHVNQFDERKLRRLFPGTLPTTTRHIGVSKIRTNEVSRRLLDYAGNPWGTYDQQEPCIFCERKLGTPKARNWPQKVCTRVATQLNGIQAVFAKPHATWIHMAFEKRGSAGGIRNESSRLRNV